MLVMGTGYCKRAAAGLCERCSAHTTRDFAAMKKHCSPRNQRKRVQAKNCLIRYPRRNRRSNALPDALPLKCRMQAFESELGRIARLQMLESKCRPFGKYIS